MSTNKTTVVFSHAIGDGVVLAAIGLPGRVVGLLFASQGAQYQIAWWADNQRRCEWLFDFEIAP